MGADDPAGAASAVAVAAAASEVDVRQPSLHSNPQAAEFKTPAAKKRRYVRHNGRRARRGHKDRRCVKGGRLKEYYVRPSYAFT